MKVGDLIIDTADDEIGIVLTEPRFYSSSVKRKSVRFVMVYWPSQSIPVRMDVDAHKNGWVNIISKGEKNDYR